MLKKKKSKTTTINRNYFLLITGIIFVIGCVGTVIFYNFQSVRSAVYGFVQTDWDGGASTTATAAHPGDEIGWTKYFSKDAVISTSTPGEISLSSTTVNWTETATVDFSAGTLDNVYARFGRSLA